ncbi:TRAP transporter small permease, partial [candidate division KSB1 bacterium]
RNYFDGGFIWGDVFIRQMVLWLGLIGASFATKEKRHINIDIVSRILKDKSKHFVNILVSLISVYVCWLLLKASIDFVSAEKGFGTTIFTDTPAWLFQVVFPIAFSIMVFRFVLNVFNNLRSLIK